MPNGTPYVKSHFMEKSIAARTKIQTYQMYNRHTDCYGESVVYLFIHFEAEKKGFKLEMA